jgi:hypothetical protein
MADQEAKPLYLTTAEVAKRFRIHPRTVLRWIARRDSRYPRPTKILGLPGKSGGKWLFPIEEIQRYEKRNALQTLQLGNGRR